MVFIQHNPTPPLGSIERPDALGQASMPIMQRGLSEAAQRYNILDVL
jgi:hypothetical protein